MRRFWSTRQGMAYYGVVRRWLDDLGPRESILDVGCWDTPVATWGDFECRLSIDPRPRPELPGVLDIVGRFPDDAPPDRFSVVTCLQVIEHVADPVSFADALLGAVEPGGVLIVSVPYRWPAERCKFHPHDPIDEIQLERWFGRDPNRSKIVDTPARLVARFDV